MKHVHSSPEAKQKPAPFKAAVLVDRIKQPDCYLLDTCYLISLISSSYPIAESLSRLATGGKALVTTPQVMDELENIASGRRRAEDGSLVLPPERMCEIRSMVYNGTITVMPVDISDDLRKSAVELLRKNSGKGNSRLGEGEASLFAVSRALEPELKCEILSMDSDVLALTG